MNTRLKKLPQNSLVQTLKALQNEINALKQAQRISGQSGVASYTTTNNNPYDLSETVGTSADTSSHLTLVTVTWVGDGSQEIAFANVSFNVFIDGLVAANQIDVQTPTYTSGSASAQISYLGETEVSFHTYVVEFYLITYKQITYYVKAYAVGSCPGTITVTAVQES